MSVRWDDPAHVKHEPRRFLTDKDTDGWVEAAHHREPPRKKDRKTLQAYLQRKNAYKWHMLQKYLRWAEKELGKVGMNPEEARWII